MDAKTQVWRDGLICKTEEGESSHEAVIAYQSRHNRIVIYLFGEDFFSGELLMIIDELLLTSIGGSNSRELLGCPVLSTQAKLNMSGNVNLYERQ